VSFVTRTFRLSLRLAQLSDNSAILSLFYHVRCLRRTAAIFAPEAEARAQQYPPARLYAQMFPPAGSARAATRLMRQARTAPPPRRLPLRSHTGPVRGTPLHHPSLFLAFGITTSVSSSYGSRPPNLLAHSVVCSPLSFLPDGRLVFSTCPRHQELSLPCASCGRR